MCLGQCLYAVLGVKLTGSHGFHSADSESGNVRNSCPKHPQHDRGAGGAAGFQQQTQRQSLSSSDTAVAHDTREYLSQTTGTSRHGRVSTLNS